MKYINFVLVVFAIIAKIQGFPADSDEGKFKPVPQEDGSIRWMTDVAEVPIENISAEPQENSSSKIPDRIHFYLHTQSNFKEPVEIDVNDLETLVKSPYDFRLPTTITIPGWKDGYVNGANAVIVNALFEKGQNRELNYVSVDWRVYSHFENYTISKELCSTAGKEVAHFIDWMHDNARLQFESLTLYGISMGAHVAGFAGKNVRRGKVHSIIAMDPARPQFEYSSRNGRLADTDAEYVETIHTNGGYWGFFEPIGQTAFYPNGGRHQPGCEGDLDVMMCSHRRAGKFLVEAIRSPEENEFHAVRCDHLEHVEERKCDQFESIIRMGDPKNAQKLRGIYYLETNSESPYAKGADDIFKIKQEIKKYIRK